MFSVENVAYQTILVDNSCKKTGGSVCDPPMSVRYREGIGIKIPIDFVCLFSGVDCTRMHDAPSLFFYYIL